MNRLKIGQSLNKVGLYNKLIAEVSRQFTKGVLGVGSYFGFAEIVQNIMDRKDKAKGTYNEDQTDANFWKTVTGQISTTAISLMAGSFFVPLENLLVKDEKNSGKQPVAANGKLSVRQRLHQTIDHYFMKDGEPVIWKAAAGSTMALALSLTAFSFVVYGLARLLGHQPERHKKKPHPVASPNPPIQPPPSFPVSSPPSPPLLFASPGYLSQPSSPLPSAQTYVTYSPYSPMLRF